MELYKKDPTVACIPEEWSFPKLKRNTLWWLNRGVTDHEVKLAVFEIGAYKAPDPDGFPSVFFQEQWQWVGATITEFVKKVFQIGFMPPEANQSIICLLSKQDQLEMLTHFRPICLSNVIVKTMSKIIASKLKRMIGDLAGEGQTSFIPGRQAPSNVVITQEAIHSLRRKKRETWRDGSQN